MTAQQEAPPVFKSTTRLVQVNVVVTDKQGKSVADLTKDDFELRDRGKVQSISVFQVERKRPPRSAPKLDPRLVSNQVLDTASSSVSVILFDRLNTAWSDQTLAREQVIRFLEQIQPQDRIALFALGAELRVIQPYTRDTNELIAAVAKVRAQMVNGVSEPNQSEARFATRRDGPLMPLPLDSRTEEIDALITRSSREFELRRRIAVTLAALEAIGQHLAGIPGRKNLIWVTGGFPLLVSDLYGNRTLDQTAQPPGATVGNGRIPLDRRITAERAFTAETDRMLRVLNNANVALYPIDARGLTNLPNARDNIDTMVDLALRTGGRAFANRNDIDRAIRTVIEESEVTYTLGYYPDDNKRDGRFRELKVKVNRPGVSVRHRKGYLAPVPAGDLSNADDRFRREQVLLAIRNPMEATGLTLYARPVTTETEIGLHVIVEARRLTLDLIDAKYQGRVDYVFMQRDEHGATLDGSADRMDLALSPANYEALLKNGLLLQSRMNRHAKLHDLRVVVRDSGSGLLGSLTVPIAQRK